MCVPRGFGPRGFCLRAGSAASEGQFGFPLEFGKSFASSGYPLHAGGAERSQLRVPKVPQLRVEGTGGKCLIPAPRARRTRWALQGHFTSQNLSQQQLGWEGGASGCAQDLENPLQRGGFLLLLLVAALQSPHFLFKMWISSKGAPTPVPLPSTSGLWWMRGSPFPGVGSRRAPPSFFSKCPVRGFSALLTVATEIWELIGEGWWVAVSPSSTHIHKTESLGSV